MYNVISAKVREGGDSINSKNIVAILGNITILLLLNSIGCTLSNEKNGFSLPRSVAKVE